MNPLTSQANLIDRTFCQLRAWLDSSSIPYVQNKKYLTIKSSLNNKQLKIYVTQKSFVKKTNIYISGADFTGKDIEKSIEIFHKITTRLGYGKPIPVNRGTGLKRAYSKNEPELVIFRHCELRRIPNLPTKRIDRYKKTIESACWYFFKRNYYFCLNSYLELGDLKTYATIWTYNYVGLYEILNPKKPEENDMKLWAYLKQGFSLLRSIIDKKNKSNVPDLDLVLAYQNNNTTYLESVAAEIELPAEIQLNLELTSMPHEKLLDFLFTSSENFNFDLKTRTCAKELLQNHKSSCPLCK